MKRHMRATVVGVGMGMSAVLGVAQEHAVRREQLPAAVATTVDRETQGATIKGYSTEREHGMTVYEAETVVNGRSRDVQIGANGKLLEVEEEVAMDALPAKVRAALEAKAVGTKITKVESLVRGGKLVSYEASTLKAGKKGEVQVRAGG